jgi:DNA-binding response OmpR family regulator
MFRHTVLVVDTHEPLLTRLVEILTAAGHHVVSCRCFEDGKRYLQRETPHAIVTELRLGAFNGLHLILLARQKAPDIAAVVYSGSEDSGIRLDAASGGACYLDKETLPGSLLAHLSSRLTAEPRRSLPGPDLAIASSA